MFAVVFGILLTIHIGAVIGWAGSSFLFSNIIGPAMRVMKPHTRTDFMISVLPKFSRFVLLSALVTIGSGIIIAGYVFVVNTSLLPTGIGLVFLILGAMAGFIALLIGVAVIYPFSEKLVKLLVEKNSQGGDNSNPDGKIISRVEEAQSNIRSSGRMVGILLVIAVIFMAISLYV